MGQGGAVVATATSDAGMGRLAPEGFEGVLLALIDPYLAANKVTPVVVCGMAGARQGWREAPYATVPCTPPGMTHAISVSAKDTRIAVHILPGVKQDDPADVMRGEETQIGGFLALNPEFDGVLCLPGTHTKWVHISAGEIVSFRTFMTGEMFDLLAGHSVLSHSLSGEGWDDAAFGQAVDDAISSPQHLTSRLFSLRARALLHGTEPAETRARLSGALIGLELASARSYWLGQDIAIIGGADLSQAYAAALGAQGAPARIQAADSLTLAGLASAFAALKETST